MAGRKPSMVHQLALIFLGVASFAILAFTLRGGPAAEIGFALLATAFPVALMVVGATRGGRLGAAALPIGVLGLVLEACVVGLLLLRGELSTAGWFLGLPVAAAVQIYGIFLAPIALVALGYALTFRHFGVDREALERLRAVAAQRRAD